MRLLLDSHSLLWFLEGNPALSAAARAAIEDQANERWVSHASAWEVAIKAQLGKLSLAIPYVDLFPGALVANGFLELPTAIAHFHQYHSLPLHHRDPFDRLLIAQALTENRTVVTGDPQFAAYGVPTLW